MKNYVLFILLILSFSLISGCFDSKNDDANSSNKPVVVQSRVTAEDQINREIANNFLKCMSALQKAERLYRSYNNKYSSDYHELISDGRDISPCDEYVIENIDVYQDGDGYELTLSSKDKILGLKVSNSFGPTFIYVSDFLKKYGSIFH